MLVLLKIAFILVHGLHLEKLILGRLLHEEVGLIEVQTLMDLGRAWLLGRHPPNFLGSHAALLLAPLWMTLRLDQLLALLLRRVVLLDMRSVVCRVVLIRGPLSLALGNASRPHL